MPNLQKLHACSMARDIYYQKQDYNKSYFLADKRLHWNSEYHDLPDLNRSDITMLTAAIASRSIEILVNTIIHVIPLYLKKKILEECQADCVELPSLKKPSVLREKRRFPSLQYCDLPILCVKEMNSWHVNHRNIIYVQIPYCMSTHMHPKGLVYNFQNIHVVNCILSGFIKINFIQA